MKFASCYRLRVFIVLDITNRYLIHFKSTSAYMIGKVHIHSFALVYPISNDLRSLVENNLIMGLFLGSLF